MVSDTRIGTIVSVSSHNISLTTVFLHLILGTTGFTETALSDSVFGNGVDPVNLKSQYEACSFDKLKINKAADRTASVNGKADIVNGKYNLL